MHAVVLAGGGGTRLWPLSRRRGPSRSCRCSGDGEPLPADASAHRAADRRRRHVRCRRASATCVVAPSRRHMLMSRNLLGEPVGRNTAAASRWPRSPSTSPRRRRDGRPAGRPLHHRRGALSRCPCASGRRGRRDGSLVTLGHHARRPRNGLRLHRRRAPPDGTNGAGGGAAGQTFGSRAFRGEACRDEPRSCSADPRGPGGTRASSSGATTRCSTVSIVTPRGSSARSGAAWRRGAR